MATTNVTRQTIIPSYPYVQYNDDANIVAFFQAYNIVAQEYLNAFNALNLPVYTNPVIINYLLDWVGAGLYGNPRPTLSVGNLVGAGTYNSDDYNIDTYNRFNQVSIGQYFETSDDVYKRILTWNLYKGDGKQFNIAWLKRRCMRWLIGPNGAAPFLTETYPVSVEFDTAEHPGKDVVTIKIYLTQTVVVAEQGDYDFPEYNTSVYNNTNTTTRQTEYGFLPIVAYQLREAIDSNAVNLPFGYTFFVDVEA